MALNYNDLPYKHEKDCKAKDSSQIRKEDIKTAIIDGKSTEVEYEVYCSCCGNHLWTFCWGHEEMY